jgi:hypothetical protein
VPGAPPPDRGAFLPSTSRGARSAARPAIDARRSGTEPISTFHSTGTVQASSRTIASSSLRVSVTRSSSNPSACDRQRAGTASSGTTWISSTAVPRALARPQAARAPAIDDAVMSTPQMIGPVPARSTPDGRGGVHSGGTTRTDTSERRSAKGGVGEIGRRKNGSRRSHVVDTAKRVAPRRRSCC